MSADESTVDVVDADEVLDELDLDIESTSDDDDRYGTRWDVFARAFAPAIAVVAAVVASIVTGALAVSFVAESGTLRLTTSGFKADGVGLGSVLVEHGDGKTYYEARIGVAGAKANGLCLSQEFGIAGAEFTLRIEGGDDDPSTYEITANGLLIDAAHLKGQIYTNGATAVNKNAADVTVGESGLSLDGKNDRFGLQADNGVFKQLSGTVHDIVVPNALSVPKLEIHVLPGRHPCEDAPPPTN